MLEEVVVTAQKRGEQRLIDVPIAITAITQEQIEIQGLVNDKDRVVNHNSYQDHKSQHG